MIAKGILGRGFKGTAAYLLHDKGGARTAERVAWTHTENLLSNHPERAWKQMSWTANQADAIKRASEQKVTGRKAELPVYHLSLSWATDEKPSREEMIETAKQALQTLGLEKHQALIVCHRDEPHPHVHILVNRVNPETGIMNRLSRSNRMLSAWALEYERMHGRIRCEKRLQSNLALERGEKPRHTDKIIQDAWQRSDTGQAFRQALAANGYTLARGEKRIVVVDPYGKAINPTRQLRGVKAADIHARLADLDKDALPTVDQVQQQQQEAAAQGERRRTPAVGKEEGWEERGALQERFNVPAGAGERSPEAATPALREEEDARWQQQVVDAAIAKEQSREAREQFTQAAGGAEGAPARDGTDERTAEPDAPLREDYNAQWEQEVMEAAIAAEQNRTQARERFERSGGHGGDSARGHVRGDRQAPSPVNDNPSPRPLLTPDEQRAVLQSQHWDQQIALERAQNTARIQEYERLRGLYDTRAYQAELRALEGKRFLFRSGRERKAELRATIEGAQMRHDEARDTFDHAQEAETKALRERQAKEREAMEQSIKQQPQVTHDAEREQQAREQMDQAELRRVFERTQKMRMGWE